MSNIAEGFERGTRQEFLNYLYIAKGSSGEVRSQLYVALDIGYLNIEMFKYLNNLASECSRLVQSFASRVKGGVIAGTQFKKLPPKEDWAKTMLREQLPDLYQNMYGKK